MSALPNPQLNFEQEELTAELLTIPLVREFEATEVRAIADLACDGDARSQYLVGRWFESAGRVAYARKWYAAAASSNFLPARRKLRRLR
ncbi:MAG TPA: hypothetical protein VGL89_12530 [Candidatus Koribacter sp.]|jgi:hypothetical protein